MSLIPARPPGDSEELRRAAGAWARVGDDVERLQPALVAAVGQLHWQGQAADTFQRGWGDFLVSLSDGAQSYRSRGLALERIADQISDAQGRWQLAMAAMAASAVVGFGLAIFTLGTSLIADAGAAAAETGVMVAIAQALADFLGVEAAAMTAAVDAVAGLSARWLVVLGSQIAAQVTYATITRGDADPLDAQWGVAAVSAGVLTALPLGVGSIASAAPVAVPGVAVRFGEGALIDATLQGLFGSGDFSWTEAATVGGGLSAGVGATGSPAGRPP